MRRPHPIRRHLRGFTLIEMAIVVVIIGLVVSGALTTISPFMDGRNAEATAERLDRIEKALTLHAIRYSCLPCPADGSLPSSNANAGAAIEGTATPVAVGSCATLACLGAQDTGVVPWRALGLSEEDVTDGWGNRIRYGVAGYSTGAPGVCPIVAGTTGNLQLENGMRRVPGSDGCYPLGNLTVNDMDVTSASEPDVQNAAYVLLSNGPDKSLAYKAATGTFSGNRYGQSGSDGQFENTDDDADFTTGIVNAGTGTSHFDDIVRFATASNVIQLCGAGSCGNPPSDQ